MEKTNKRNSFGGTLGFVLAAAGSAVGLGNIWRFPSLAAKDGGGLFIFIYLILALTFGFALLTTEVAIGRKTKQGPLTAYGRIKKGWGFLGPIATIVPFLIMPYYCVIGGWVLKYLVGFLSGGGAAMADANANYFGAYIGGGLMGGIWQPIAFFVIFLFMCAFVVIRGVNKGIESMSKIIMPILLCLVVGIAIFSLTISHTDADGETTRTGLEGFGKYIIPDFANLTLKQLFVTIMDAMGQLFYSLSVAMGIMVAYGSYVKDEANLAKSINQIEIFDTVVAFLAGAMIIPAIYAISGPENMSKAGAGLMFIILPQVFMQMGAAGHIIGAAFFIMVLFAALTSAVSILEAVVASLMDKFGMKRTTAALAETGIAFVLGTIVCFGYNLLEFNITLPNGTEAQILDVMDYVSNQILMPVLAIGTCILIGWVVKPKYAIDEVTKNGERFSRKGLYNVMIKYIAPALLLILLVQAVGVNIF